MNFRKGSEIRLARGRGRVPPSAAPGACLDLLRIPVLLRASVPKLFSECRMEIVFEQNIPITAALDATDSNVR
jgi:hypothetical protein